MFPVLDTQLWANPPLSGYGTSKIACNLVWGIFHLPIVAEGRAQAFKFLHIVKQSDIVAKHRWVWAKEGHGFDLVHSQRQPFHSRVGVESVKLELEVVGSIGSKCNVISTFRVGNFGYSQGCHCPMVRRIQEFASHLWRESRVEGSADIPASILELPWFHLTPCLCQWGYTHFLGTKPLLLRVTTQE